MIKTEDILNLTEDEIKKNPTFYNLAIKTTIFYLAFYKPIFIDKGFYFLKRKEVDARDYEKISDWFYSLFEQPFCFYNDKVMLELFSGYRRKQVVSGHHFNKYGFIYDLKFLINQFLKLYKINLLFSNTFIQLLPEEIIDETSRNELLLQNIKNFAEKHLKSRDPDKKFVEFDCVKPYYQKRIILYNTHYKNKLEFTGRTPIYYQYSEDKDVDQKTWLTRSYDGGKTYEHIKVNHYLYTGSNSNYLIGTHWSRQVDWCVYSNKIKDFDNDNFLFLDNFRLFNRNYLLELFNKFFPEDIISFLSEKINTLFFNHINQILTSNIHSLEEFYNVFAFEKGFNNKNKETITVLNQIVKYFYEELFPSFEPYIRNMEDEAKRMFLDSTSMYDFELTEKCKEIFRKKIIENYTDDFILLVDFNNAYSQKEYPDTSMESLFLDHITQTHKLIFEYEDKNYTLQLPTLLISYYLDNFKYQNSDIKALFYNVKEKIKRRNKIFFKNESLYFNSFNINYLKVINEFYLSETNQKDKFYLIDSIQNHYRDIFNTLNLFYTKRSKVKDKWKQYLKENFVDNEITLIDDHSIENLFSEGVEAFTTFEKRYIETEYLGYFIDYLTFIIAAIDYFYSENISESNIKKKISNYLKESKFDNLKLMGESLLIQVNKIDPPPVYFPNNATSTKIYNLITIMDKIFRFEYDDEFKRDRTVLFLIENISIILGHLDKSNPVFKIFYSELDPVMKEMLANASTVDKNFVTKNFLSLNDSNIPKVSDYFSKLVFENEELLNQYKALFVKNKILK